MPHFSERSLANLNTCHPDIVTVCRVLIKRFDCTILEGLRSHKRQDKLFEQGRTQVKWPNSKHNVTEPDDLSMAVDMAPYPINWKDRERFHYFAGHVIGIAHMIGVTLRWGGDWDRDTEVDDNRFDDLPHFELVN